jgi:hypothetical protein
MYMAVVHHHPHLPDLDLRNFFSFSRNETVTTRVSFPRQSCNTGTIADCRRTRDSKKLVPAVMSALAPII